jgi:hypothetical protein
MVKILYPRKNCWRGQEPVELWRDYEIGDLSINIWFGQLWAHITLTLNRQYPIQKYPDMDRVFTPFKQKQPSLSWIKNRKGLSLSESSHTNCLAC